MFLTYLDDGGKGTVKVFGGIVVDASEFKTLEVMSGVVVAELVPPSRRTDFEFHASDLFLGTGSFAGIAEEDRHKALLNLISVPQLVRATYIYTAVDTQRLQKGPVRSAQWIDLGFFMVALGVDLMLRERGIATMKAWMESDRTTPMPYEANRPLNLMIIDEPEQDKQRHLIRATFRELRGIVTRVIQPTEQPISASGVSYSFTNRIVSSVDDVFFGSSSDSIGLQIADACNWVMWRHLADNIEDKFFNQLMLSGLVKCAKPEPEWAEYRQLYRAHDEPLS